MFEQSLVESTGVLRINNRKPALISASAQLLLVAMLLIWPILHPEVILPHTIPMTLFAPPKAPIPPPPPQRVHLLASVATPMPMMMTTTSTPLIHSEPAALHSDAPPAFSPIQIGDVNGNRALPFSATSGNISNRTITVVPSTPNRPDSPQALSTGVSAGLLLEPLRPVYPEIARIGHIEGTVNVAAVISKAGKIESAHATSGPETLRNAAVASVREARYKPFLLNGQPTEVEASFSIHFRINQ